jgi:crotonobetainyl-CoA:carnitine CoA-transferase CaiB-like acyl-CoA transferase
MTVSVPRLDDVNQTTPGPLAHIRVLDFTALVQGPLATQMLGDLGADVVKIERPEGEWSRHWGIADGHTHGETDSFLAFNRNKRSVIANLKDPAAIAHILEQSKDFDVVVENFRPGVMAKLGLGYEDFAKVNPGIIFVSSSGYGQHGPYVTRPGQDMLIQALSGVMFLTGRRSDPPTALGVGIADQYTGLHIVIGILSALLHRGVTGQGQRVELNLLSCMVAAQQQELTYFMNHGEVPERPVENHGSVWATAPFGIYQTSDGHLVIAMTPCPIIARALDMPELAKYDTNALMLEYRREIYAAISEKLTQGTTDHWIDVLLAEDVWCAPVHNYEQLMSDPQVLHNGMFWDVGLGEKDLTFRTVGTPFVFSKTPARLHRGVPDLGQHTEDFFGPSSETSV